MADMELRETVGTKLARIEEKLDTLLMNHEKLCQHVNHENEKMDARLTTCEEYQHKCENEKTGQVNVYKYATAILGLVVTILTILKLVGQI
jgi:uncharacterized membrane protein YkgB